MRRTLPLLLLILILGVGARLLLVEGGAGEEGAAGPPELRSPESGSGSGTVQEPEELVSPSVGADPERAEVAAATEPATAPVEDDSAGRQLVVRLLDPAGTPAAGIEVNATIENQSAGARNRLEPGLTDGEGLWRTPLSAEELAHHEHLSLYLDPPDPWLSFRWAGPMPTETLELELFEPSSLSGQVTFTSTGAPVSAGTLQVWWRRGAGVTGMRTTKLVDGAYAVDGVAGDVHRVGLVRRDARYLSHDTDGPRLREGEGQVQDFAFDPGSTVHLLFLDRDTAQPVPDVLARTPRGGNLKSGADGRLTLTGVVDPGGEVLLRSSHTEYAPARKKVRGPDPSGEFEVVFELERGAVLAGKAVDVAGVPLPGLSVVGTLQQMSRDGHGSRRQLFKAVTKTDAEGNFALRGLPHCEGFDLSFAREGKTVAFWRLDLPEVPQREVWVVDDPVIVSGRVVDDEGVGCGEVKVSATGRRGQAWTSATTDDSGRFRLEGVVPGPWHLSVQYGDPISTKQGDYTYFSRVGEDVDVPPAGLSNVRIELPAERNPERPWVTLTLEVSDASTGLALTDYHWVQVNGLDSSLSTGTSGGTLEDGRLLRLLRAGSYDVWFRHDDYEDFMQTVELDGSADAIRLPVRLAPLYE